MRVTVKNKDLSLRTTLSVESMDKFDWGKLYAELKEEMPYIHQVVVKALTANKGELK